MKIRFKKKDRDRTVITLVRADGTTTGGRLGSGDFGAVHDLAHFTVETTLDLRHGFLGLVAAGWNVADFAQPGAARRLPAEAIVAECSAQLLAQHCLAGTPPGAAGFSASVRAAVVGTRPDAVVPELDHRRVQRLWTTLQNLLARYRVLPVGGTLELDFAPSPATRPSPAGAPVRRAGSPTPPAHGG